MKSASHELAESHTIVTMHGRPGVRRRILDLINIPHMEMLHRALHRPIRSGESLLARIAALHHVYAAMHNQRGSGPCAAAARIPLLRGSGKVARSAGWGGESRDASMAVCRHCR